MSKDFNILITGVGGQGVILMSELLGKAAVEDGLNVRGSEALGMAARGGSVTSSIRLGEGAVAPLIPSGRADIVVGMEPAEALRNTSYLSGASRVIINTRSVFPFTYAIGQSPYPSLETIIDKIRLVSDRVIQLDAVQTADEAGSALSANIVMLGALFGSADTSIKIETIKKQIRSHFSDRLSQINIKAFELGYQLTNTRSQA